MILAIGNGTTYHHFAGGSSPHTFLRDHYEPTKPRLAATETRRGPTDGGELQALMRENLTESVTTTLVGTESQIRAFIQNVEAALSLAAEYAHSKRGNPWYIYFDPTAFSVANAWRSQILYGALTVLQSDYDNGYAVIEVEYTRRFYWEGALTELTLTNGHGSGIGGVTVYNTDDATYDDWVAIDGAEVGGVLPTPIRVSFKNDYTERIYEHATSLAVWGGLNHAAAHLTFASASYNLGSWSGDNEVKVAEWDLSTTMLDNYAGRYYRVLLQTSGNTLSMWARVKVLISSLTVVYEGDLVQFSGYFADLGVVQLPPWLPGETGLQPLQFTLYCRKEGGGDLSGSYLKLLPADAYREMIPLGYGSLPGGVLIDDQIESVLWHEDSGGSNKTGHYYLRGGSQYLWPGKDATLYVKLRRLNSMTAAIQGTVRVHYRPRRLSV